MRRLRIASKRYKTYRTLRPVEPTGVSLLRPEQSVSSRFRLEYKGVLFPEQKTPLFWVVPACCYWLLGLEY